MAVQEKIEGLLKKQLSEFLMKYNEAKIKFNNKQKQIIKEVEPNFDGNVEEFFDSHTIASQSTDTQNKYYDIVSQRFVNYDVVSSGIGIVYDEVGKKVHSLSKRTKEYLILEYYTNVIYSLTGILDKIQPLEMKMDETLESDDNAYTFVEETPPSGPKF